MKRWYSYPHARPHDGRLPFGRVEEVEVLHQDGNGTAIVKDDTTMVGSLEVTGMAAFPFTATKQKP